MTSNGHVYFILTEKPKFTGHIDAGKILYMLEHTYRKRGSSPGHLQVTPISSSLDYEIDMDCMKILSVECAELLLALNNDKERLKWFTEGVVLQTALGLTVGTSVTVQEGDEELRGIIRYIGRTSEPHFGDRISGKFFGIELQGSDKGKGNTDGSYHHKSLFTCARDCGLFAPFSRVRLLVPSSLSPTAPELSKPPLTEGVSPGDRVTYFMSNKYGHGMVVEVLELEGKQFVRISTDTDANGKTGGEVEVPLECVMKGEVPTVEQDRMDTQATPVEPKSDQYMGLDVNTLVEVTLNAGNSFGIIRWVGKLADSDHLMAGLELEEDRGVSDGSLLNIRYFTCPPKRALFVKLNSCRPDSRFQSSHSEEVPKREDTGGETEFGKAKWETVPPISSEQVSQILTGRMKGIQGHCNSCYMDATLFSLFSCSSVLDSMLYKSTTPRDAQIQKTLLFDIVNPLRSKGFVEGRHVMKLRQQLEKHGYSHSFTTEEKDPEEFLTVIMHNILALDPLLKLSSGGKVQESYCYQIFLDHNHSLVIPKVQQLLEHSFHSTGLKLAEVPSCLILQMPRFGKKFKMFDKIVPSLTLDITDLLSEGPQQCILCGSLAEEQCTDCFKDPVFSHTGFKVFCRTCSLQVHTHPQRLSHQPTALDIPEAYHGSPHTLTRDTLELFAVLCIETSHYVSFIKYGPNREDWIFFDSMADRQGEIDGFNIPEVRMCPEVSAYLEMSPSELANQGPRDMNGVAKRLFCDAYMYLYQSTSMCLYR